MQQAWPRFTLATLLITVVFGCTPAPPGTQYWVQAQRQFEQGDYADTLAYLNDLLAHETNYAERASAWKVLILSAMTRAAMEWEEACDGGVHFVPQWKSRNYKICITQYRRQAKIRLLALLDAVTEFDQVTHSSKIVTLAFPLPDASTAASPILRRIKVGSMPNEDIRKAAAARTLDRHFILQSQNAIGAKNSTMAKSRFASLPVEVEKTRFLLGVARTLHQASAVFEPRRLDDGPRREMVLKRTLKCLQPALRSEDRAMKTAARMLALKTRG